MAPVTTVLRDLTSVDALTQAVDDAANAPILIYKHSSTCGTSAMAMEEIMDLVEASDLPVPVYCIHIQGARDVSREAELLLGVRHESPQIVLVGPAPADDQGRRWTVLWHGSHFRVTAAAIRAALRTHLALPASTS